MEAGPFPADTTAVLQARSHVSEGAVSPDPESTCDKAVLGSVMCLCFISTDKSWNSVLLGTDTGPNTGPDMSLITGDSVVVGNQPQSGWGFDQAPGAVYVETFFYCVLILFM